MKAILPRLTGAVLDLLLPLSCAVCHREGRFLCPECEETLPRLEEPYCSVCADPGSSRLCDWCASTRPAIAGIRAPYLFEGAVREMVHSLKYRNLRAAAPDLAGLLSAFLETNPIPADVLMPVPLHGRGERERGYNQSELVARELSKRTGVPMQTRGLRRVRNTPPQVLMASHQERRRNMEGAFGCTANLSGQRVLLIDDVVTTGSTMFACAEALGAAGATSVWGLALAR